MSREFRATLASRRRVFVPLDAPYIPGGIWIYGSTRKPGVLANQLTGWLAGRSVRMIPGTNVEWDPPFSLEQFHRWLDRVGGTVNRNIATWAVQLPRDRRRRRFNLLLLDRGGAPTAFAKFTENPANSLGLEALKRFYGEPTRTFWSPGLLSEDRVGNMTVVITTPMPNLRHWPARLGPDTLHMILDEIRGRLDDLAHPDTFVHGDFAQWNVRRLADGRIAVVDWEESTRGVSGADALWFLVCFRAKSDTNPEVVLRELQAGNRFSESDAFAAALFWLRRLDESEATEIDTTIQIPRPLRRHGRRIRTLLEEILEN